MSKSQRLNITKARYFFVLRVHRGSASGGSVGAGRLCRVVFTQESRLVTGTALASGHEGDSTGNCALALNIRLPPESVSFLLHSDSIDRSKSHTSLLQGGKDSTMCVKGGTSAYWGRA